MEEKGIKVHLFDELRDIASGLSKAEQDDVVLLQAVKAWTMELRLP